MARSTSTGNGRERRATIRDVAKLAQVSSMTVSNVINGVERYVRDDTRKRVLKAVEELNYRPASSARNLRLGKRHAIGVVIVDDAKEFLASPFTARIVSGLCGVLNENGYVMIVQGIQPDEFESSFPLKRAEADAYCIRLSGSLERRQQMLNVLKRVDEPIVVIQETLALEGDRCNVRQDDFGGAQLLADHFLARGAERIVMVSPLYGGPMTGPRAEWLQEGMRRGNPKATVETIIADPNTFASAQAAAENYLRHNPPPDAFIGINDDLSVGAMRAVQDFGLRVPEDVMIACFNGFNSSAFSRPSLTTVISRATEIGITAGELLMQRLSGKPFEQSECVLPVSFRKGESTR